MVSIEQIIDTFITEHELDSDEIKEPIISLVNKCIEGIFKFIIQEPIPEPAAKTKTQKVLKENKIEDPSTVEKRDDLFNCTTGVLNQFCKDNNVKVGGNKTVLVDRVWRFLQGETSDEDKSARGKSSKAANKTVEKHQCSGCNAKGQPCGVGGTEARDDMWFCWRHISEADDIIAKTKGSKPVPAEITPSDDQGPSKPKVPKTKSSKSKKPAAPVQLESDTD